MFTKIFGPPPLANDYSYAGQDDYDDHAVSVARDGRDYIIVGHVPREMSRTFWNFIMHGWSVGCAIKGRRTLIGCEIMRKRTLGKGGGGADKRGGGAFTIPILSVWKNMGAGGG